MMREERRELDTAVLEVTEIQRPVILRNNTADVPQPIVSVPPIQKGSNAPKPPEAAVDIVQELAPSATMHTAADGQATSIVEKPEAKEPSDVAVPPVQTIDSISNFAEPPVHHPSDANSGAVDSHPIPSKPQESLRDSSGNQQFMLVPTAPLEPPYVEPLVSPKQERLEKTPEKQGAAHADAVPATPQSMPATRLEPAIPQQPTVPAESAAQTMPQSIPATRLEPAGEAQRSSVPSGTNNLFQRDAFYVQIGRFSDFANVEKICQQYEKEYPMVVEKVLRGPSLLYVVYIGPLKKDERGAVLETFRNAGFIDVFLKKTK
ncbi:MAG: SPOR domain-containing protein, partial [Treponema sp.]